MSTATIRHEVEVDTRIAEAMADHDKVERKLMIAEARKYGRDEFEIANLRGQLGLAAVIVWERQADYTGWSRFFLVTNTGGHIHRDMSCSTCFPTTQYAWLYELSGLTEAEAVAEYGEILCSVCFPSAPVEWTNGKNKKDEQRKADEAALKAIAKSPEGKKVISARELVASKRYRIERHRAAIDRWNIDSDHGRDAQGIPAWVAQDAARAEQELPKLAKQLDRAEAKLAAAEVALIEALGGRTS